MIRIARPKARTLAMVALPVVAVAITVPTVALATGTSSPVIKGCVDNTSGELYAVAVDPETAPACPAGLGHLAGGTPISWNQEGAQGVPGLAGTAGTAGTAGAAGKSAYQLAVDNGFVGTVTQWLASLKGTAGSAGTVAQGSVVGYRMVATKGKAAARTAATYTVMCKDGRYALGGGMNGTSDLILNGSGPTVDAKGWTVRVTNVGAKARTIKVYVSCAFSTP